MPVGHDKLFCNIFDTEQVHTWVGWLLNITVTCICCFSTLASSTAAVTVSSADVVSFMTSTAAGK